LTQPRSCADKALVVVVVAACVAGAGVDDTADGKFGVSQEASCV
jgi:hypothetical protein